MSIANECAGQSRVDQVFLDLSPLPPDLVSLFAAPLDDPFFAPFFLLPSFGAWDVLSLELPPELPLELFGALSDDVLVEEALSPELFDFDSVFELSPDDDSLPESLLLATFFLSPDLKSVSYQPPPFKRNATAEIFFRSRSFPHEGH